MTADAGFADRVLALEGSRNLRDLGGYRTQDGRRVRRGLLYRSGSLAGLTPAALDQLKALGLRGLCDLRTTEERSHEPYGWHVEFGLSYWSRDYPTSFGELRKVMASDLPTAEAAREAMLAGYRQLPYEQAPAYRELFRRLASGEVPLLFNCSAGKDRAGTGAALILSALGVPREIVVEDYVLTDKVSDFRRSMLARTDALSILSRLDPEIITAILSAQPDYIAAAFESVDATNGSLEDYLRDVLDIGPNALETIRNTLLE